MTIFDLKKEELIIEIEDLKLSSGQISRKCGLSVPTVRDFINRKNNTGIDHVSAIRASVDQIRNTLILNNAKGN